MAGSISQWQGRLDAEGSVTFRTSRVKNLVLVATSAGFVLALLGIMGSDGPSIWGVAGLVLFGLLALPFFTHHLITGRPCLTVSRTGITANRGREVRFTEIREVITSSRTFGFTYSPAPGEELTGRWEQSHGLKYASVVTNGFVDEDLLAQWLLHLADPAAEIDVEERYAGLGRAWRLQGTPTS
ncbi:MAG TPA: hypothetical protein VFJ89_11910 [Nocardioides sp.]|nr:hypothetical protein [Nocardioides sp.]